jgi:hypothetical protein
LYGRPAEDPCCGLRGSPYVARSTSPFLAYYEGSGTVRPVSTFGAVQGFDLVSRADSTFIAVSTAGDIRLYTGQTSANVQYPGPPRAVPLAPGDNRIDLDPSCEAAWPRFALIEDALVITWQERCAPEPRWRIVTRLIQ